MADQKVSDLPSLNGADVDAADLLYIVDSSAGTAGSKKITVGQYQVAPYSAGTANGVMYLNGSNVVTTGSGLTFDGAKLSILSASPTRGIVSTSTASGSTGAQLQITQSGIEDWVIGQPAGVSAFAFWSGRNTGNDGTELMRLTSTGLGIGTSSPAYKLDVDISSGPYVSRFYNSNSSTNQYNVSLWGQAAAGSAIGYIGTGGSTVANNAFVNTFVVGTQTSNPLVFNTVDVERMRLDSSGNLGLGVTPSAWWSGSRAMQIGQGATFEGRTGSNIASVSSNSFINTSGVESYINTAAATKYNQNVSGDHRFYTAPSGTAGNAISFTQAMTLDASGNLAVGTSTTTNAKIFSFVNDATLPGLGVRQDGAGPIQIWQVSGGNECARITSAGDLLVGTTGDYSGNGARQTIYYTGAGTEYGITLNAGSVTTNATAISFLVNGTTSGSGGTAVGSISCSGSATAYNTSSDYRLKDNQQPLTGSGAFIDALQPKTWNWKADGSKGVGFIAHEAQVVSPSSVVGEKDAVDADGKPIMQAMEYGSAEFIANIVAELQSLRARVAALEAQ